MGGTPAGDESSARGEGRAIASRRRFLGRAAGTAAASAAFIGGLEAAGTRPARAATAYSGPSDWFNVQTDASASGDGQTDDYEAIQGAIDTVGPDGIVYFPVGSYAISKPLTISQSGTTLIGSGPIATNSKGGCGAPEAGSITSANPLGTITGFDAAGSVIVPLADWQPQAGLPPAAIVVDGSGTSGVNKVTIERMWVQGGNVPKSTTLHGIAGYGNVTALCIRGCGIAVLYGPESDGICMVADGKVNPDGVIIDQCLCQYIGGNGFEGSFGDATITRCHAQNVIGNGFVLSAAYLDGGGGNIRVSDCRGDLASNGFLIEVAAGSYLGMIQLSNCSTQRNLENGFMIHSAGKGDPVCPVYLVNCVAQGDGRDGGSYGGYRIGGGCAVTMSNCSCHVDTVDDASGYKAGYPLYAVVTAGDGVGSPVLFQALGGFMNAAKAWSHVIDPPLADDVRVYTHVGGQWTPSDKPVLETSL